MVDGLSSKCDQYTFSYFNTNNSLLRKDREFQFSVMIFQLGVRRIAAAASATYPVHQHQSHRMIVQTIQSMRQLPIAHTPKRIRSTMIPLMQQVTNQVIWSQQQQVNVSRLFMTSTLPISTHRPENVTDCTSSSSILSNTTSTTTSRSLMMLNLECGILDEDDDG
jgi:hypothetical protein